MRRGILLGAVVGLIVALAGAGWADETPDGLYDRPVLVVDPGFHTAPIIRADVDFVGTRAVTGSDDKTVRVWRLVDGTLERTVRLPSGPGDVGKVYAVAVSPDGETIAAGGWTDPPKNGLALYLFDANTGAVIQRLEGLPSVVLHLAFSPDGRQLAAGLGGSHGVRLYERGPGGWVERIRDAAYGGDCYGVAFARDGRFATTSLDGLVRLYDAKGVKSAQHATGLEYPFGLAFNPRDNRLAVGFEGEPLVHLYDGNTLAPLSAPSVSGLVGGNFSKVAWSRDGRTLYAAGRYDDGTGQSPVVAWDEDGTRRLLSGSQTTVMSLKPLPGGDLVVGAQDPFLARLDAQGRPRWRQEPRPMDVCDPHSTLAVSADGQTVELGLETEGKTPVRFDVEKLVLTSGPLTPSHTTLPLQTTLSIKDWKDTDHPTVNGRPLALDRFETSRSLAIAPDGQRFVLGTEWWLRAFDKNGTSLWRQPVPGIVWAVNITGNGKRVVAAYGDGTVRWHRLDDGAEVLALFVFKDGQNWVAWDPEGRYAGTARAHTTLRWVMNEGRNKPAREIPAERLRFSYRPQVIRRILTAPTLAQALLEAEQEERGKDLAAMREDLARQAAPQPVGARPRLFVLTLGVGDSREASLKLKYSQNDADAIAREMQNQMGGRYDLGFESYFRPGEATRENIYLEMERLRWKLQESSVQSRDDLVVLFFFGHGRVSGPGALEDFYLLPVDVKLGSNAALEHSALSGERLRREIAVLSQYARVVLLIDACEAGALSSTGEKRNRLADELRRLVTGNVTLFASSGPNQVSLESETWAHGALTKAVLEALRGEADRDANGALSVEELADYVRRKVPVLTHGRQSPTIETRFGGDLFAVGF
ncbi:caspase family protein [Pararhodospirillum oryzae]|uniref:Peptidase C14 caspase domain-containing protein n=1 Tax=Pararhodospirillum oryzae TaxID=478448 RepID=A0A512H4K7_9PROT|nr:caspase family protein [Pararhodospirillum oryzae]GEO80358.1 hypothetical protein ROR02_04890 [Pararhodospirillum oryzae]